jgi:DNA adenine methylase
MIKTPIRYAGGKSRAIKLIAPLVPNEVHTIVSPFMGGGSLEVNWASNGKRVIGYDIFDMLVNFWSTLLTKRIELVNTLQQITPTDTEYKKIKEILMRTPQTQNMLKDWHTDFYKRTDIIKLDDVTRAAYYYFNHNCSYGPGYLGWGSSVYLNQPAWSRMITSINKFIVPTLSVSQDSFDNVIRRHNTDFLYLDPPYYTERDTDNKMHGAIYPMKNIPVHHDGFNHELLRDLLKQHKGKFMLSYNNCETIREYYKEFNQTFPEWNYSMGNGETRIGKNRTDMGITNSKDSHEILITNFSPVLNNNQFF